jgi:hypothetical protein
MMKRCARAGVTLILIGCLCAQLSAQRHMPQPVPSRAIVEMRDGNPPARVRQPGSRTRLIVAIAFVAGLVGLAVTVCREGGCGK